MEVDLGGADLRGADLSEARLTDAGLRGAQFTRALFGWTILSGLDLREAKGLETVIHQGPSTIGIDTVVASNGEIPEIFLRGAGVPDSFITYMRSLACKPFEFYS
ncbi:MAG: pentapeptide repeat-containing protein, partial [Bryobacteraceae bacterium]